MAAGIAHELRKLAEGLEAHGGYQRLVLLVGPHNSGKTAALRALCQSTAWPYVNLNLQLAARLLDVASRFREIQLLDHARAAADDHPGDCLVLDNIELLFEPKLAQDPLRVLLALARSRTVVAAWPGHYAESTLTYGAPPHPEHRRYRDPDCAILPITRHKTASSSLGSP